MSEKVNHENEIQIDDILKEVEEIKSKDVIGYEIEGFDLFSDSRDSYTDKKRVKKAEFITVRDIFNWLEDIIVPTICIIIFMSFIARPSQVIGISMQPTLYEGDRVIIMPCKTPQFGDVVVVDALHLPNKQTGEMGEPIIKRVIGLEGDTIFIDAETGDVYRNGDKLKEDYINEKIKKNAIGNQVYPLTVPENSVFVLGDNRNHSTDSRIKYESGTEYEDYFVGCIEIEYIMGVAVFRVLPFDRFGGL